MVLVLAGLPRFLVNLRGEQVWAETGSQGSVLIPRLLTSEDRSLLRRLYLRLFKSSCSSNNASKEDSIISKSASSTSNTLSLVESNCTELSKTVSQSSKKPLSSKFLTPFIFIVLATSLFEH